MNGEGKQSGQTGMSRSIGLTGINHKADSENLKSMLNAKKWPSLRILFTGHLLVPIPNFLWTSTSILSMKA